jgi:hypothetical protein
MFKTTISVVPVQGGWSVQPDGAEPTVFLRGASAEAHAQRLGEASWRNGASALVLVHDLRGVFVGAWRFGPGHAGALAPRPL